MSYFDVSVMTCLISMAISCVEMGFCERFRENSKQIDFGYRRIRSDNNYDLYLAIDKTFWKIKFKDQTSIASGKFVFVRDNGIDVPLTKRYRMAFCIFDNNRCLTGFVDMNSSTIDWVVFDDSRDSIDVYANDSSLVVNTSKISFGQQFRPSIAFVPNFAQRKRKIVYFLEQTWDPNKYKFNRQYRYYDFEPSLEGIDVTEEMAAADSRLQQTAIDEIPDSMNLIAVLAQRSAYDELNYKSGYGLILIFDTKIALYYCYTSSLRLSYECQRNQLKVLIDCSTLDHIHTKGPDGHKRTTTKQDVGSHDNTTQKIIFIVLLTLLPLVCLLLIGLFLFIRYQRNKTRTSSSNDSSGSNSEKSVVKVLFKREGWEKEV